jgi:hypothetical protein
MAPLNHRDLELVDDQGEEDPLEIQEYKMQKMGVQSIVEDPAEVDDDIPEFLFNISLEDLKQKYLDLRKYTQSKEQEVEVLQSIIENKDEQIGKQLEMIDLL